MTTEDTSAPPADAPGVDAPSSEALPPETPLVEPPSVPPVKLGRVARLKAERERLTTRALETRDKYSARRGESQTIDTVFSVFERDTLTGGPVLAGAVAFRVFLFQVPYVYVLVAGFGLASDAAGSSPSAAARDAGIGGLTAQAIRDASDFTWWSRISAFVVGGFALFLAARSAVKVLVIIHCLVWDLPMRKPKKLTRAAGVLVGIVTLALGLAWCVEWLRDRSLIAGLFGTVLYVLVPAAAWLLVSWFMPRKECPWWALIPGAALFGVGVELLHLLSVYWISHLIATKSDTYGALGTALALLFWAYVLGRLIVASATLNAARWNSYVARHPEAAHATGSPEPGEPVEPVEPVES